MPINNGVNNKSKLANLQLFLQLASFCKFIEPNNGELPKSRLKLRELPKGDSTEPLIGVAEIWLNMETGGTVAIGRRGSLKSAFARPSAVPFWAHDVKSELVTGDIFAALDTDIEPKSRWLLPIALVLLTKPVPRWLVGRTVFVGSFKNLGLRGPRSCCTATVIKRQKTDHAMAIRWIVIKVAFILNGLWSSSHTPFGL